jgi:hypothetical protein
MREHELYPFVCEWLGRFLRSKFRSVRHVWSEDTSRSSVATFLERHNLTSHVPWWATLDIAVDVTGAVLLTTRNGRKILRLAIVEVKTHAINLRDLSQVIGYAKVVLPHFAFLISPKGWSESLHRLIRDFKRADVLEYAPNRKVIVAKWDTISQSVRMGEMLMP